MINLRWDLVAVFIILAVMTYAATEYDLRVALGLSFVALGVAMYVLYDVLKKTGLI